MTSKLPAEYPAAPLSATILRFRCPHCGRGRVLAGLFATHERCEVCGFVFKRGNPAYFSGAIFINYLLGAGGSLLLFLVAVVLTWPHVPWKIIGYAAPIGVVAVIVLLHPLSKMILLSVDVRMRPITEAELQGTARVTGDSVS